MSAEELAAGKISVDNVALFMCDVQEKFRPAMIHFEAIANNAKKLVEALHILEVPLVVTEQYPKGLGSTVKEINIEHAVKVVPKTKFSMVIPEVEGAMKEICNGQLKCVVLFGIEAHVCVEQTAVDLVSKGIKVHIVADASTSRAQEDRLLAFERLKQIGCFITTTENVIFKLLGDKDHPKFSEIRPLIKDVSLETGLLSKIFGKYTKFSEKNGETLVCFRTRSTFNKMPMKEKLELVHEELYKLSKQALLKSYVISLLNELKILQKGGDDAGLFSNAIPYTESSPVKNAISSTAEPPPQKSREKNCEVCFKVFKRPQDLKRHMALHKESSNYLCEECGRSYRSSDGLSYHKALHHASSVPTEANVECHDCGKLFPSETIFRVHLKNSHQRAKSTYICSVCVPPARFQRKDVYKNHMAYHTGTSKLTCQFCPKVFSSHSNLRAHLRIHDFSLSLQCPSCDKKFNSKRKLTAHTSECLNKKQCEFCKFTCVSSEEMVDHMKRVHPADYAMQEVFGPSLEELN